MIQVYLLEVGDIRCRMEETTLSGDNPVAAGCAGGCGAVQKVPVGGTIRKDLPGWDRLTPWQQDKISRCTQTGNRALCMGGQLLLQYVAYKKGVTYNMRSLDDRKQVENRAVIWQQLYYPCLLEDIPAPFPLQVAYEAHGKPYIVHMPWHYNLSHSGDYVAIAVGDESVGIDIQQMRSYKDSLVKRFFSEEEAAAHECFAADHNWGCRDRTELFYALWCRKEAYGKLKGTGLTEDVLKRNMLEDVGAHLYEYGGISGYRVCVCGGEI